MSLRPRDGPRSSTVVDLLARRVAMAAPNVTVRVRRSGRWTVVEVEGEMDLQVLPLLVELLSDQARHLVFELRRVTFLDCSGIGVMVEKQRRVLEAGGCVRLAAPSAQARRVLTLTGSDRVFVQFDSLEEAMRAPIGAGPESAC